MTDPFLQALQSTTLNIGQNLPQTQPAVQRYSNVANMVGNYSGPYTEGSKVGNLGVVTTQPGGSTRYEPNHPGIDIANNIGTPIPAFTGGVVTSEVSGKQQGAKDFGNYIIITDAQGNKHRYSHLSNELVKIGDPVQPGEEIGQMGNSGQAYSNSGGTGSHLDYRILNTYGKYVDPSVYINALSGRT